MRESFHNDLPKIFILRLPNKSSMELNEFHFYYIPFSYDEHRVNIDHIKVKNIVTKQSNRRNNESLEVIFVAPTHVIVISVTGMQYDADH